MTVRYYRDFKWIWLNRGDGAGVVEVITRRDLRFWDERQAGIEVATGY